MPRIPVFYRRWGINAHDMADLKGGDVQGPVDSQHCRVRTEMAREFHEAPAVIEEGAPLVAILLGATLLFLAPFVILSGLGCFSGASAARREHSPTLHKGTEYAFGRPAGCTCVMVCTARKVEQLDG